MLPLISISIALSTLALLASCDDTVADDIGTHMMARISELLSPEECQAFHVKLLRPEENVRDELDLLSENNNPIGHRRRRDITSTEQCKETLLHWLETEGDTMYWDRLSRALQMIGRSDVSLELGKNINQDKNLEIKKNVEEYHETVKHLTSSLLLDENQEKNAQSRLRRQEDAQRVEEPELEDWDGLELIIERKALRPYNRSLFEWTTPVTMGIISGFLTSFILAALALYSFFWILNEGSSSSSIKESLPPPIFHSSSASHGGIYYTFQQLVELGKCDTATIDDVEEEEESLE